MADESSSSPAGSNAAVQSHLGDEDGVSDRRRRIEELVERAGPISAHPQACASLFRGRVHGQDNTKIIRIPGSRIVYNTY